MTTCPQRRHRWQSNPPGPGTVCIKCGKVYQSTSAPSFAGAPPPSPPNGTPLPADRAARVAAAFAALKSPSPDVLRPEVLPPGESDADELPPGEPNGWQKGAAKKMRRLFFGALDYGIEAMGRKPGEAEEDDEEDVEEAFARSLAAWFPDGALSPGKDLILATTFAAASVWAGSKKLDTTGAPVPRPTQAAQAPQPAAAEKAPQSAQAATVARNAKALSVFDGG